MTTMKVSLMPWLNAENPPMAGHRNDTSVAVNPHAIILQGHCQ